MKQTTAPAIAGPKENGAKPVQELAPLSDTSLAAEASSAHSRINIPVNLANWKSLDPETQEELLWFHQYALDNGMDWPAVCDALGYDRSNVWRMLKGNYLGSWANVVRAIRGFKKLVEQRGKIQKNEFAINSISLTIFGALDYALANNSITVIESESRQGKTITAKEWARRNNHGKSVFVTAPVVGGIAQLIRTIAQKVGVGRGKGCNLIADDLYRAFNANRILIVDEAHRLLPNDTRTNNPQKIEFLRDLHDQTGCAVALLVTKRFNAALKSGAYQYEQLIGRIGMPVRIRPLIPRKDILPIVKQFVKAPGETLLAELDKIANAPGRLGILTETLKAASRIASTDNETLADVHVRKAIAMRVQMSGGEEGAK